MLVVGRYALFQELARGGMATVHLGKMVGPFGFTKPVAIKRLHPHLASDPEIVAMMIDEARLTGRVQHPHVVSIADVVHTDDELFLVMELVHGETLSRLLASARTKGEPIPIPIVSALVVDVLDGLHAAHEAKAEDGRPLGLVHRDVSPHNVMVRADGSAVVVDFGVAKAAGRIQTTEEGKIKGKLPYMAPEQLRGKAPDRRVDVYAVGAMLFEALVGRRLIQGANEGEILEQVLLGTIAAPSEHRADVPAPLDAITLRALAREPEGRFADAAEMARAIEEAVAPARASQVASWLRGLAPEALERQSALLAALERAVPDDTRTAHARGAVELARSRAGVAEATNASATTTTAPTGAAPGSRSVDDVSTRIEGSSREGAPRAPEPSRPRSRSLARWAVPVVAIGAMAALALRWRSPATSAESAHDVPSAEPAASAEPAVSPAVTQTTSAAAPGAPSASPVASASTRASPAARPPGPRVPGPLAAGPAPPSAPPRPGPAGCTPRRPGEPGGVRKTVGPDGEPRYVVLCP